MTALSSSDSWRKDDCCSRADSNPIPTARHLELLDFLRGVAILLVFICHCPPALPPRLDEAYHFPWDFTAALSSGKVSLSELALWPLFAVGQLGELGVAIFFVVSGFCIYQTYTQTTRPEAQVFFVRRFFRIYPPYLLTLLILLLVFPLTRLSFTRLSDWAQIVVHLLMCHNLSSTYVDSINPVFWSLAVEIQLYLLFPLSLIWVRRASYGRVLPLLAAMEITVRFVALFGFAIPHHTVPTWAWAWPYVFWFSWSTGAAIADAHFNRRPLPFVRIHPLVWLGAGLMDTLVLTGQFSFTFFALFTASLIARSLRSMRSEAKESWPLNFVRRIGIYSYSIYLIHGPILAAIALLYVAYLPRFETHPFRVTLANASSWLVVFPLAALMYHSVEKPSISLGKWVIFRWWPKKATDRSQEQVSTV